MRLLTFTIAITLFASCSENPQHAQALEKPEQKLVYISNKGNGFDIYKNTISGNDEVRLTSAEGWEWYPQFREASGSIVYNSQDTSGNFEVRELLVDGQSIDYDYSDLPGFDIPLNGAKIAYTVQDNDVTNIVVIELSRREDTIVVTNNQNYNGRPKWSADGDKLAYISDRSGSNEIYVYNFQTQQESRLTDNKMREKYISWSPDSERLALTMQGDSTNNDIYILGLESGDIKQITSTPEHESEIAWSLDGSYIAYHAQVNEADDIFVIALETGQVSKVTDGTSYYGEPAWILE